MHIVRWEPGTGSSYRVAAAPITNRPDAMLYCFGIGDYAVAAYIASRDIALDSFAYFVEKWDSKGMDGNYIDLWAGFMALRHILGQPTDWEALPHALRREAEMMITGGGWLFVAERDMRTKWKANWRAQLQPIIDDVRRTDGWHRDNPREPFAATLQAAIVAYTQRFGTAPTTALIPAGMRAELADVGTLAVEEWDGLRPGYVYLR